MNSHITILGAGPTGLAAANQLEAGGHQNWDLYEATSVAGGLATSILDSEGFTWDLGGHVQFSHYEHFDKLMDELLGKDGWLHHDRESWVWMRDRFVPYPFQFNIRHLPEADRDACIQGLEELLAQPSSQKPANFGEWIDATFGSGLARIFMRPYNFKVWAYPPERMAWHWIGDRVAVVDLERVKKNIAEAKDDVSWGPNNRFRFPKFGGTGSVWKSLSKRLPQQKQHFQKRVVRIETARKRIFFEDGSNSEYEKLLSTMPLDELVKFSDLPAETKAIAQKLVYSSTHIVGVGVKGAPDSRVEKKCWMYFPEDNCPFYRVTVFSNYSPNNVPDINKHWSLMAEVSESPAKPVDGKKVVEEVCQGFVNTKLIPDREAITHTWHRRLEHGYPTPFVGRDEVLNPLFDTLETKDIYSRGRFGAWKYEVSNQDHSAAQGVEWVRRMLEGGEETTLLHPEIANRKR